MYGLVNKAIEDLVISLADEDTWLEIARQADVDVVAFVSLDTYDDDVTYRLVTAASAVLGIPAETVLESFGEHWVRYTGREGYGHLMQSFGTDVPSFLHNLDALHARVNLMMPDLRPPSFEIEDESGDRFIVHDHSDRVGLAPMVTGLLRGIGALFDQEVQVERRDRREDGADHDAFAVTLLSGPHAHDPARGASAVPAQATPAPQSSPAPAGH
jgi:hypothetical protein